jgi:predicted permease
MVARLKPGTSLEQAGMEIQALGDRLEALNPPAKGGDRTLIFPLKDYAVGSRYTASFTALFAAVGCLFLIACANLTNLLLARARGRAREFAVQQALGASEGRLALASLSEPLLLSLLSSGLGLLGAQWAISLLKSSGPADIPRQAEILVDGPVVAFAIGISLMAGLVIGLASQHRRGIRRSPGDLLSGGRVARGRKLQSAFTVVQVSLTFALLAGVGLLSKTVRNLQDVDPGFDSQGAAVVNIRLSQARYPEPRDGIAFLTRVEERIGSLPGVVSVGFSTTLPLGDGWSDRLIRVEGDPSPVEELPVVEFDAVSPGFIPAMGISLLRGRLLEEGDARSGLRVAAVNETMARTLFPDGEAIGKRFSGPTPGDNDWIEVVGVVEDVRHHNLPSPATPKYYESFMAQEWNRSWIPSLVVRFRGEDGSAIGATLRELVKDTDGGNPLVSVAPLGDRVDQLLAGPRLNAFVLSTFTLAALSLASLGLYAIMAFGVAERRKEIGIRMALGAGAAGVRAETLGGGMRLTFLGILLGLPLALGLGRLMESLLFGVGSYDPSVLAQVALVLGLVASLACLIPSTRASRVDPMESLREE